MRAGGGGLGLKESRGRLQPAEGGATVTGGGSGWPKTLQVTSAGLAVHLIAGATGVGIGLAVGPRLLRIAGVVYVAGIVGAFVSRVVAGIVAYRGAMRHPWPKVTPTE